MGERNPVFYRRRCLIWLKLVSVPGALHRQQRAAQHRRLGDGSPAAGGASVHGHDGRARHDEERERAERHRWEDLNVAFAEKSSIG